MLFLILIRKNIVHTFLQNFLDGLIYVVKKMGLKCLTLVGIANLFSHDLFGESLPPADPGESQKYDMRNIFKHGMPSLLSSHQQEGRGGGGGRSYSLVKVSIYKRVRRSRQSCKLHKLNGVPFLNRRYKIGVPYLLKIVHKRGRVSVYNSS